MQFGFRVESAGDFISTYDAFQGQVGETQIYMRGRRLKPELRVTDLAAHLIREVVPSKNHIESAVFNLAAGADREVDGYGSTARSLQVAGPISGQLTGFLILWRAGRECQCQHQD